MVEGWALIHAHLASKGIARRWAVKLDNPEQSLSGWRQGNPLQEDVEEGDESLEI